MRSFSLLFLCVFLCFSCRSPVELPEQPLRGVADFSATQDLDRFAYLNLAGQWEFYWDSLLSPADFKEGLAPAPAYIAVPGSWTANKNEKGETKPPKGKATFRLKLKLGEKLAQPALFVPMIWGAHKIWVNGTLVRTFGQVEKKSVHNYVGVVDAVCPFSVSDKNLEIVVQISNYHFFLAGIKDTFYLGTHQGIAQYKSSLNTGNLLWLGCLCIMAIYHFTLWFFRRKSTVMLYFGAICALMAIKLLDFGSHHLYEYWVLHLGGFSSGIQPKVYYLCIFWLAPFGLLYVRALYPAEAHQKIVKIVVVFSLLYCALFVFLPTQTAFAVAPVLVGFTALFSGYIFFVLVRAAVRKRQGSIWQMVGILIILLAALNDILHTQGIGVGTQSELIPAGFGAFLLIQIFILAYQFSTAFNRIEDLSENLERKVIDRTEKLTESNEKLQLAYDNITKSVRYASRIQEAMLGSGAQIKHYFADSFIFYKPKDIVSGDFYWFAYRENKKIVIAADCTGHGVPGAFMTILGHQILNEVINRQKITDPAQILSQIDKSLVSLLHKDAPQDKIRTKDGMDIAILVFDDSAGKITFAGAKNPLCYVTDSPEGKKEMVRIKGSNLAIESVPSDFTKEFVNHTFPLRKGDVFYLFSDGFQDQFGGKENRKYFSTKFRAFLLSISELPVAEQEKKLSQEFANWKGTHTQTDDVLVLGIKY